MDLDKDYQFFKKNLDSFLTGHSGELVVIKDCKVLGFYKTESDAMHETLKSHPLGTFILQSCLPSNQLTQRFHSRIAFS